MQTIKTTWTGIRPLIVHNGQLADPLNQYAKALKEVSSKRKKTDADYEEMARIEYEGGLYYDEDAGPYMPSDCIEATIEAGARKSKLGKDFKAAVFVADEIVPIQYKGPRDPETMMKDPLFVFRRGVGVNGSRVIRTRPCFPTGWKLSFTLEFDERIVNAAAIQKAMLDAGTLCGICEWRPKFGRFLCE